MNKTITVCLLVFFLFTKITVTFSKKNEIYNQIWLNQNAPMLIQAKEPIKPKSTSEIIYEELKDWSATIVTVCGFIAGYFLIRRKLVEKHISTALEDIQKANGKIMIESTKLLDECIPKSFESLSLSKEDLQNELDKIKEVYLISQSGSSECQTLLYYLKFTLQESIKHYPGGPNNFTKLINHDFYGLMINILDDVIFYSKQVVTIPKSTKIKSVSFLNPKYAKYTNGSKYSTYKHFNLGFINDPHSALFLLFINHINYSYNTLLKRSAFKLFRNSDMLFVMMYMNKIYAPLKIDIPKDPKSDSPDTALYLIGYEIIDHTSQNETKKFVRLIYTNPNDSFRFLKSFIKEGVFRLYEDSIIKGSGFKLSPGIRESYEVTESIRIDFELGDLEMFFILYKSQIKQNLPVKRGVYSWLSNIRRE